MMAQPRKVRRAWSFSSRMRAVLSAVWICKEHSPSHKHGPRIEAVKRKTDVSGQNITLLERTAWL